MKFFKKIAGICLALMFCFGMVGLVACSGKTDGGADKGKKNAYNFEVYTADNDPAYGYYVQLCSLNENGELEACYQPIAIDENGKVSIVKSDATCPSAGVYEVHVLDATKAPVEVVDPVYTPAKFSTKYIKLVIVVE